MPTSFEELDRAAAALEVAPSHENFLKTLAMLRQSWSRAYMLVLTWQYSFNDGVAILHAFDSAFASLAAARERLAHTSRPATLDESARIDWYQKLFCTMQTHGVAAVDELIDHARAVIDSGGSLGDACRASSPVPTAIVGAR